MSAPRGDLPGNRAAGLVLEIVHGTTAAPRVTVDPAGATIGRSAVNSLVIGDYHLSGEHARVVNTDGAWVFHDLRSTNGSAIERAGRELLVDEAAGWQRELQHGDVLLLGTAAAPVRIVIVLTPARSAGAAPLRAATEDPADPADDEALNDRLIATRSIIDLPVATDNLEHDPASALQVYKALQPLGARLDRGEAIEAVVEATFQLLPRATHVAVLLRADGEADRFALATARQRLGAGSVPSDATVVRASRAVLRRVLAERAVIHAANAQEELASSESIHAGRINSILALPLWRGEDIFGVIQVDNRDGAGMFSEQDLEIALLLGSQAALAIDNTQLVQRLRVAEDRLRGENVYLKRKAQDHRVVNIIGDSAAMKAVMGQIARVVDTRATVCIEGETGTGKELIASAVHTLSARRDKMFVAQNCAALPENLLESELFGHKRGAFTSADSDKKGLFEIADGGTLFLDEMGEMPLSLQAKLLRVLQEGTIRPVGATAEKQIDVRIICATNRDLAAEVEKGRFRQDLYYRLMVFPIRLPPLRERPGDIPALAAHFLTRYAAEYRIDLPGFTPEALDALAAYSWPGNIRELENEIQRVVIQCEAANFIEVSDLSPRLRKVEGTVARIAPAPGTLKDMMDQVERWLLTAALRDHGNNKTRTAATLGITREGLHKKLTKFGI